MLVQSGKKNSPNDGSQTSGSTQGSTLVLVRGVGAPEALAGTEERGGPASAVGPGREPEDQGKTIEDEGGDSEEELRGAEFEAERAAVDDECLDYLFRGRFC